MNLYSSQVRFTSSNAANAFNSFNAFSMQNASNSIRFGFVLWIRFAHKTNSNARGFNSFCAPLKGAHKTNRICSRAYRSKTSHKTNPKRIAKRIRFPKPTRPGSRTFAQRRVVRRRMAKKPNPQKQTRRVPNDASAKTAGTPPPS